MGKIPFDPSVIYRLSQLAAFAPRLRAANASFGEWRRGDDVTREQHVITSPWYSHSELAAKLIETLNKSGWILSEFDWSRWAKTKEAKVLLSSPAAIASTDADQLTKILTTLVRKDRFCEGALAKAFGDGLLLAAAVRAEALLKHF